MMAGRLSLPEADLTCPICCDIFRNPVVLKCSHSFCSKCLEEYWSGPSRDCPLCRAQSLDEPVPSLTLKNLCESLQLEGEGMEAEGELYCDPGEMCPLHGEKLKLFCLPDQEPMCVVCLTSRKHKQHDCCPISEAVLDVKGKMMTALSFLQEKKDTFDKMKSNFENNVLHIQVQAQYVEKQTHEEFQKLHNFLEKEEKSRMEALKREERQKTEEIRQKMGEVERNITSVCESIRALEEEMALEGTSVLHRYKKTLERINSAAENPVISYGSLIDVTKHVGSLSFHVWEKMGKIMEYSASIISKLDLRKISECRQGPAESVSDYYNRLHHIFNTHSGIVEPISRGDVRGVWETHLINAFINGLRPDIRHRTKYFCSVIHDVPRLCTLIKYAGKVEKELQNIRENPEWRHNQDQHQNHVQPRMQQEVAQRVQNAATQLKIQAPTFGRSRDKRRGQPQRNCCYTCGQNGHWSRECPNNIIPQIESLRGGRGRRRQLFVWPGGV